RTSSTSPNRLCQRSSWIRPPDLFARSGGAAGSIPVHMGVVRIPVRPLFAVTLLLLTASIAAACSRGSESAAGPGERAMGAVSTSPSSEPSFDPPIDPDIGINNISHVIVIVQENRSFDHYFGTFPGADGYARDANGHIDVCVPDPDAGH